MTWGWNTYEVCMNRKGLAELGRWYGGHMGTEGRPQQLHSQRMTWACMYVQCRHNNTLAGVTYTPHMYTHYTHVHIHPHTYTYTHTTHMYMYTHIHTHMYIHTLHTCIHVHPHTCTYSKHVQTHTHTYTLIHSYTLKHIPIHTNMQTHTQDESKTYETVTEVL